MSISIPAQLDASISVLKNGLLPKTDISTASSSAQELFVNAARLSDILTQLTGLIDSVVLTATGGTTKSVQDTTAYTGVNSLVGAEVTFTGNITPALAGIKAIVVSNTVSSLFFGNDLPGTPVAGDTYQVAYTAIDAQLSSMNEGKPSGSSTSNPYGYGPTIVNALVTLIGNLGGVVPAWLTTNPFTVGSPHAGGSAGGHGGANLLAYAIQLARDTVAAYTKPV